MTQYLIYVRGEKVESLSSWFRHQFGPHSKLLKLNKSDVAFDVEARKTGFVSMMIGHEEFTRLQDFLDDPENIKKPINREAVLVEYLTRMGDSPRNRFSPAAQSVEDIITIVADIIEEKYF
jgi:hypothetical protein